MSIKIALPRDAGEQFFCRLGETREKYDKINR